MGWTSFLTDLSSEAIYPLLPGFVKSLGGTSLDIGLIDGTANAVAAVVRLPSGALSDRIGRRRLVLVGYGFSAVVRPLMGVISSPVQAILIRAADRFGKGIRTAPRDALVTDLVEPDQRGRAFGHIRSLDHLGAALGPLLAMLFLLAFPGRERTLFVLSILPGLATLIVIGRFVHDPPRRSAAPRAIGSRLTTPQIGLLVCVAVWSLGAASEQFLLLRSAELGTPAALVPLVWFGTCLAKSLAASRAGRFADRVPPRLVLAVGWLIFAAAYAALALTVSLAATILLVFLVGLAQGVAEPAERKLVAALSPDRNQGGSFGWYALVQGLMSLPAGMIAGSLWDRGPGGPATAFVTTAVLAVIASGMVAMIPVTAPESGHG